MMVYLNGEFVPAREAVVSVFDRGYLYGDGLFETVRVAFGGVFRWEAHWARLVQGAEALRLSVPLELVEARNIARELIRLNGVHEAVLRVSVSRGIGPRGYSPRGAVKPSLVMALHPVAALDPACLVAWKLRMVSVRVQAGDGLATIKSANKLRQVLARAEAEDAQADEAVLLNDEGLVAEGAASNLFWCHKGGVCTPPLACGMLPGITRNVVMEICRARSWPVTEETLGGEQLKGVQGLFCTLSSVGIAEATHLDGAECRRSSLVADLHQAYVDKVWQEVTGAGTGS